MSKQPARTHREKSGMEEPKVDHFTDVKRALNAHLMKTDSVYQKASRDAKLRNQRRKSLADGCAM